MPDALFVHLGGGDLNALVGDVIDAIAEPLFAELFFDINACGLQVKCFARGAGRGLQISAFVDWVSSPVPRGDKRVASGSGAEGGGIGANTSLRNSINAPRPSLRRRLLRQPAAHAAWPH